MSDKMTLTMCIAMGFNRYVSGGDQVKVPPGEYQITRTSNPIDETRPDWFVFTHKGNRVGASMGWLVTHEGDGFLTLDIPAELRTEITLRNTEKLNGKRVIEVVYDERYGYVAQLKAAPNVYWEPCQAYPDAIDDFLVRMGDCGLSRDRKDYMYELNF